MAVQTEEWNIELDQFDGWQTSRDSDDIPDGKSPDLLNVRITGSHFRGASGYEIVGTRDNDAGEIISQYTYKRDDGKQRMVRVRDDGSSGVLEWYDRTNEEWYTLLSGLTSGKIMGFAEFNTSTTNNMIFCNGVENLSVWTGSTTRLTQALSGGETTINVSDTSDFPASGTIIYNGIEIAYTSKTDTTFEVSSAHASAGSDDGVAEAADDSTHSGITKGNILLSAKDRLWIAGQPDAPNALDYSDEGDFSTFTGGSNRSDSGTEDFFNIGGRITGLSEKGDEIIVLGEDGGDGFSFIYPTATTKAPNFREIFRMPGRGCISQKSVFKVENEVYFANRNGIVALSDLEGTEKVFSKSITREILPTAKGYDFSEAASVYFDKESILLVSCKSDPDFPGNDIVIGVEFYRTREDEKALGLTKFDWPVNDWAILENADNVDELYFGSALEMNSFKALSTNQNDGAPRTIKYATKRFHFDSPFQNKMARLGAVRGFIKAGTEITVKILFNSGFLGEKQLTIKHDGPYVSQNTLNSIGAFALGTNPIGATNEEVDDLKRFLVYLDIGVDYAWSDIQFIFESDDDGGTFLINRVALAADFHGFASQDNLTIGI